MREITACLLILALTFASCKKDDPQPTPDGTPPIGFTFYNNITDNTTGKLIKNCDAFHEFYLDQIMDFGMFDGRAGTVEFDPDGSCINHWEGDDSFISWNYYFEDYPNSTVSDRLYCNILEIRIKNKDTGMPIDYRFYFWEYDDDSVVAVLWEDNNLNFGKFIKFFPK